MPAAMLPADEAERLRALAECHLLERRVSDRVKLAVELAADLLGRPSAALSLIGADRQVFRPGVGLPFSSIVRDDSFCAHAILSPDRPLVVENALRDTRFADNPLVIGGPGVRFYAGAPVRAANGQPLGTLCVLDQQPGVISQEQLGVLSGLAKKIEAVTQEDRPILPERKTLLQDLRQAALAEGFGVRWQPIVEAASLHVTGYEALIRWSRMDGSAIAPDTFIPLAEASGLIRRIDSFMLKTVCAEAAQWSTKQAISINVSARWFQQARSSLVSLVARTLAQTGLTPSRLVIELTERVLIADPDRALWEMRRLKALGVRIALDDFGTGYSSLSYLEKFPFDTVKLDKAFVRGLGSNHRAELVGRAVIRLAHALDMSICAEGVEDARQLAFLQREGCNLLQGYLIGHPASAPFSGSTA